MTALLFVSEATVLRQRLEELRRSGNRVGVVLTMGALHEGHLSLVRQAASTAEVVVVTLFVNPTQFGPNEDFERYPRQIEADTRLAASAGATIVFAPEPVEMYPQGEQTRVIVSAIAEGMCGRSRPDHFSGVATVVSKFFNLMGPGVYFFGLKDYQQYRLIERLAIDLLFPVEVRGLPIVRDSDGVALSSRNKMLREDERIRARGIPGALQACLELYRQGDCRKRDLEITARLALEKAQINIDYVEIRDALTLEEVSADQILSEDTLVAIAAQLGSTRLIDNIVLSASAKDILPASGPEPSVNND